MDRGVPPLLRYRCAACAGALDTQGVRWPWWRGMAIPALGTALRARPRPAALAIRVRANRIEAGGLQARVAGAAAHGRPQAPAQHVQALLEGLRETRIFRLAGR